MSNIATIDPRPQAAPERQSYQVIDPVPLLDTARFEHMWRIAKILGGSNLIPPSLCKDKDEFLPEATVVANCFLVVNQAVRWNMDPFAVAQCVSVVHGKLCYEGKLIAAVIENKLGIRLAYTWNDKTGDALKITVSGKYSDEPEPRIVEGTVGEWKTTGNGSPWAKQPRKQLAYRGAREWARLHAPSIMLGVYSADEMGDLSSASHSSRARDVTPPRAPPPPEAAAMEHQPTPEPEVGTRVPPPPPAEDPTPDEADFDKIIETYREAVFCAEDVDALDKAWGDYISPIENELPKPLYEQCAQIDDQRRGWIELQ